MSRAFLIVLDSVGCGGAPDAAEFGDEGSNTLGHIIAECAAGRADEGRKGAISLPHLDALGLGAAVRLSTGIETPGLNATPSGTWGVGREVSNGKDTPSGHWELAGLPVPWDWHYFPDTTPAFPDELVTTVCRVAGTDGILGNCHASGVPIINEHCAEHLRTGWPICYTSADSVFQIAAHEQAFGLDRLLKLCSDLAPTLHAMKVGRVIARPFTGDESTGFKRTTNRRDFAIKPPSATLCDWVQAAGGKVQAIGKIGDIFTMQGIDSVVKGADAKLMDFLVEHLQEAPDGSLTFANFVEFDSLFGHPRDVAGYARALEWFDMQMPRILENTRAGDLLIFTADHGNDPTWRGNDHTREQVPILAHGVGMRDIGVRGFADVAASIAAHLNFTSQGPGKSFL